MLVYQVMSALFSHSIFHATKPKPGFWVLLLWAWWWIPTAAYAAIDVTINGVDDAIANNIRLHLNNWDTLPGETATEIEEAIDRDVIRALQALGYYRPQIKYSLNNKTLVLDIQPGPPIRWNDSQIRIEQKGQTNPDFAALTKNNPFEKGKAVKHQDYENFKRRLLNTANELGYLDAQMQRSQLRINPEAGTADVVLHLETGERYRLGKVDVSNSEISQDLVDILIEVKPGEWFNANLVGDIYNRLLESGYFASVNIVLDKQPPATANLQIEAVDSPEHRVSTGFGYGTDTGPRFQLKWQRPHTNSRGNSWNSQLQISKIEQFVTTRYRIPYPHPQKRYISWDTGLRRKEVEQTVTQVFTTGLLFHLLRDSGWQYSTGVNLEHERSQVNDDPEDIQTYVIPSAHAAKRGIIGDASNPLLSYHYWLDLAHSATYLKSDTNFTKAKIGFDTVWSISPKQNIQLRLESGVISSDEFDKVPISQRFFTGGDISVRGYKFDTISPLNQDGDLIGGEYFSAGSIEYRYQLSKSWQLALFSDAGRSYVSDQSACNTVCQDTGEEYRTSYGIGARWLLPVGFIALDLAFPQTAVGLEEEPDDYQVHFYLHTSF